MPIDKPDSRTTLRLYERIEELEHHLKKANSQAEDFERKWYLVTDRIADLECQLAECQEKSERMRIRIIEMHNDWKKGDFDLPTLAQCDLSSAVDAAIAADSTEQEN